MALISSYPLKKIKMTFTYSKFLLGSVCLKKFSRPLVWDNVYCLMLWLWLASHMQQNEGSCFFFINFFSLHLFIGELGPMMLRYINDNLFLISIILMLVVEMCVCVFVCKHSRMCVWGGALPFCWFCWYEIISFLCFLEWS